MKVVLTGGTGLIGNAMGKRLFQMGTEVVILARKRRELGFPGRTYEWDGEKEEAPKAALAGCEAVIHLAGENIAAQRWSPKRKKHLRDSRILSMANLKKGLDASGIKLKTFISASAVGYYGDRGDEELTEDSSMGSGFLAQLCREWEDAAATITSERTVCARFGVVLSCDSGFLSRVESLFSTFGASRLGSGQQWFSWIHIDDLTEALTQVLMDKRYAGPVNMVAPDSVTNQQLTKDLKQVLKTFAAPPVPEFVLKVVYGELAQALLGSQKVIPTRLKANGFLWKYPTLKSALMELYPGRL